VGFLVPAAIVVVADQITKQIFWRQFTPGFNVDIIPGILRITLVKNTGAAFGLFDGGRWFFITASVIAVGFILYLGFRLPRNERYRRLLLGLILGGAVGNLIDRVYDGAVIDFIEMGVAGHWWPVYNVADIAVTVGAVLLLIHLLWASKHADAADAQAEGGGVTETVTGTSASDGGAGEGPESGSGETARS
jgi:signal peptidase II